MRCSISLLTLGVFPHSSKPVSGLPGWGCQLTLCPLDFQQRGAWEGRRNLFARAEFPLLSEVPCQKRRSQDDCALNNSETRVEAVFTRARAAIQVRKIYASIYFCACRFPTFRESLSTISVFARSTSGAGDVGKRLRRACSIAVKCSCSSHTRRFVIRARCNPTRD